MAAKHDIFDGPDRGELFRCFIEGRKVEFKFVAVNFRGPHLQVIINSIEREDGSGDNWNFAGYHDDNRRVSGFYSTKWRTGWVQVTP